MPIILEERKAWAALQEASEGSLNDRIGGLKFRLELQGGREVVVKNKLLNKMGVKLIYGYNDYNGPDPLLGFAYQGKMYPLSSGHGLCLGEAQNAINGIFDKIASGNLPQPVTEFYVDITQNGYYFK